MWITERWRTDRESVVDFVEEKDEKEWEDVLQNLVDKVDRLEGWDN